MHFKNSKNHPAKPTEWKAILGCSEEKLRVLAAQLSSELSLGDRVLLEGQLGAGKSTFARAVLESLGAKQPPEGSPTFAIAHEYDSSRGAVIHIDFYRLRNEEEIDDAGVSAYFWERPVIILAEWLSMHPDFEKAVLRPTEGHRNWLVKLEFCDSNPETRNLRVYKW
jgi:tRNA threonylcarbamoyl adenosine modification protein YjeE